MCGFCNVWVYGRVCNVWVCVCVGFVICGYVCGGFVMCGCVCMCGVCNVCVWGGL